ncbi:MAG: hypothetical protein P8Q50_02515, partial [Octadecabacter sp.]|nr:hypothetical protein [Octadecabacter sp.]
MNQKSSPVQILKSVPRVLTSDMKRRQAGPFNQRARLRRRPPSSPLPAVLNNSSGNGVFER